jgi:tRNA A37 threonylcarbamoyladenosine modification protein TsaB
MNYLAIDTSGKNLTVIIKKGDEYFTYYDEECGVSHSVDLMPRVEELLVKADFDLSTADFSAVHFILAFL